MEFRFTAITMVFLLSGLLALEVVRRIWPRRTGPGGWALIGSMVSASWWSLSCMLEAGTLTIAQKVFWSQVSYVGILFCSVLFLVFALRFADLQRVMLRPVRLVLGILPAASLAMVWTNDWHGLVWTGYSPAAEENMILYLHGPVFWAIVGWIYTALMASSIILAGVALRLRGIHRQQALAVLLGLPLPWVSSALYVSGLSPLSSVDFTPIGMTLTGLLLAFAVRRLQLIDLMPVALGRIFEALEDGLMVLDPKGRIVEANPAIRAMLGFPGSEILGRTLQSEAPSLMQALPREGRIEIRLGEPPRDLDVRVLPLNGAGGELVGRLVVLHDVSRRKRIEEELAARRRDLEVLATTDALTGLFNRRHADEVLANEVRRTRRYGSALSVAVVDVDHFKGINDRFGHESGDRALQHVANVLRVGTRSTDVVFRYGGEEFLILLTHTGPAEAAAVMERLRVRLSAEPVPGLGERLTVSAGVASCRADDEVSRLIQRADAQMYRAKEAGRDRVFVEDPCP